MNGPDGSEKKRPAPLLTHDLLAIGNFEGCGDASITEQADDALVADQVPGTDNEESRRVVGYGSKDLGKPLVVTPIEQRPENRGELCDPLGLDGGETGPIGGPPCGKGPAEHSGREITVSDDLIQQSYAAVRFYT